MEDTDDIIISRGFNARKKIKMQPHPKIMDEMCELLEKWTYMCSYTWYKRS